MSPARPTDRCCAGLRQAQPERRMWSAERSVGRPRHSVVPGRLPSRAFQPAGRNISANRGCRRKRHVAGSADGPLLRRASTSSARTEDVVGRAHSAERNVRSNRRCWPSRAFQPGAAFPPNRGCRRKRYVAGSADGWWLRPGLRQAQPERRMWSAEHIRSSAFGQAHSAKRIRPSAFGRTQRSVEPFALIPVRTEPVEVPGRTVDPVGAGRFDRPQAGRSCVSGAARGSRR